MAALKGVGFGSDMWSAGARSYRVSRMERDDQASEQATVVTKRSLADADHLIAVSAPSADELLALVAEADEPEMLLVAIDHCLVDRDADDVVALAAVLVQAGVVAFETRYGTAVQRVLDTHSAILAGSIEDRN